MEGEILNAVNGGTEMGPRPVNPGRGTQEEAETLAGVIAWLPPVKRDQEIKIRSKELGCKVPTLERLVKQAMAKNGNHDEEAAGSTAGAGRALTVRQIEPWPGTVEGASLLNEIVAALHKHVVMADGAAEAAALWVLHSHAIEAAHISPRLAITSPERRCGKTTLLMLIGAMVARPISTANITAAALYRTVEAVHPTLMVDEADSFLPENDELRGIINAGHCRANSQVLRTVELPQGHAVHQFDVWAPLALAAIGKLPPTIEDRAIKVAMRRRRPTETVERLRLDRLEEFTPIARRCVRWALDHLAPLRAAEPPVPRDLHDRAADNWRPLLAIADLAGTEWGGRARRAALALSVPEDAESLREMLLADLKTLIDRESSDVLFTGEVLADLALMVERPWPELRKGKPITARQLAGLLHPLGIISNTVRRGVETSKGYRRSDFEDSFARYLSSPFQSVTTSQPA